MNIDTNDVSILVGIFLGSFGLGFSFGLLISIFAGFLKAITSNNP